MLTLDRLKKRYLCGAISMTSWIASDLEPRCTNSLKCCIYCLFLSHRCSNCGWSGPLISSLKEGLRLLQGRFSGTLRKISGGRREKKQPERSTIRRSVEQVAVANAGLAWQSLAWPSLLFCSWPFLVNSLRCPHIRGSSKTEEPYTKMKNMNTTKY